MPKAKRDPHSFDSRLLLALQKGCQEEMRVPFATARQATRFRFELNSLRAAFRASGRLDWQQLYQVGIYIHKEDPTTVILQPKSSQYKAVLDAAGIPDILAPDPRQPESRAPSGDAIEDFLSDIKDLK